MTAAPAVCKSEKAVALMALKLDFQAATWAGDFSDFSDFSGFLIFIAQVMAENPKPPSLETFCAKSWAPNGHQFFRPCAGHSTGTGPLDATPWLRGAGLEEAEQLLLLASCIISISSSVGEGGSSPSTLAHCGGATNSRGFCQTHARSGRSRVAWLLSGIVGHQVTSWFPKLVSEEPNKPLGLAAK